MEPLVFCSDLMESFRFHPVKISLASLPYLRMLTFLKHAYLIGLKSSKREKLSASVSQKSVGQILFDQKARNQSLIVNKGNE
jgi:hypothetical protein